MQLALLDKIIQNSLEEDIGWGDLTTESTIPKDKQAQAKLIAKQEGVLCGIAVFARVMQTVDASTQVILLKQEGQHVNCGDVLATLSGRAAAILMAERVALNLLQRMSGIATQTAQLVAMVSGTKAAITDTRKTTPGLRMLEKYAVRMGGGRNHRFNLSDGVLIKDNHIRAAGGITQAVLAAKAYVPHLIKIEVETENLAQVQEALDALADVIMLDNMDIPMMAQAVALINGRALVEASGNMGEKDLRAVAQTGVDIISIGAITHTIKAMDISLRFEA
ncbi:MAG: carboxylating nicotinate-nucleotide diphosphorylase [Hyphomonadaceae bacterium]|nr:carboxylating nicotinate-nucleotide diphosphorylase [Clostridia bacterium]